jgi:DNA-binding transcriptional LysR family regulator
VCGQDFPFIRTVLLAGAGVGGLPAFQVQRQVAAGQLVPVLPGWSLGTASISIVHASARHVPRKVTAFRDFVIENFRTQGM